MDEGPPDHSEFPNPTSADLSGYYYRGGGHESASADRLQALADGYFGLNWAFLFNVLMAVALQLVGVLSLDPRLGILTLLGVLGAMAVGVTFLTLPHNRKIVFGKGWPESNAFLASVLMGLNSALCCGLIGYVVMQQIAYVEMKKYGIRSGFLGVRKKAVLARIAELHSTPTPKPPSFTL